MVTDFIKDDVTVSGGGDDYSYLAKAGDGQVYLLGYSRPNDEEGTVSFSFASTSYQDLAGNLGTEDVSKTFTYDSISPTLAITISTTTVNYGETATLSFTWSEAVDDFDEDTDITLTGSGTVGSISATANPLVYTAPYTAPQNNATGTADITVSVGEDKAEDSHDNGNSATSTHVTKHTQHLSLIHI